MHKIELNYEDYHGPTEQTRLKSIRDAISRYEDKEGVKFDEDEHVYIECNLSRMCFNIYIDPDVVPCPHIIDICHVQGMNTQKLKYFSAE